MRKVIEGKFESSKSRLGSIQEARKIKLPILKIKLNYGYI